MPDLTDFVNDVGRRKRCGTYVKAAGQAKRLSPISVTLNVTTATGSANT